MKRAFTGESPVAHSLPALPLLVLGVFTDHVYHALALDNLAFLATALNRRSHSHGFHSLSHIADSQPLFLLWLLQAKKASHSLAIYLVQR
jgi:hypothetical protein